MAPSYDLDQAPVVVTQARWKVNLALLGIGLSLAAIWMIRNDAPGWLVWGSGAFLLSAGAIGLFALIRPARLVITPERLCFKDWTGCRCWAWRDLSGFCAVSHSIAFSDAKAPVWRSVGYALIGLAPLNSGLPGSFALGTERLVDLLKTARARWA